jgi:hypothetical protein
MKSLIVKLHNILYMIKGFKVGYGSMLNNKLIIKHQDKYYLMQLTEVKPYITETIKGVYGADNKDLEMYALLDQFCR